MAPIVPGTLRHDIYQAQMGLASCGFDPGPRDGWWGTRTASAATAMFQRGGPATPSGWGILMLETALNDTGWLVSDPADMEWTPASHTALGNLIRAHGVPRALFVPEGATAPASPPKPQLHIVKPSGAIYQGGAVVTQLFLHTTATAGSWWVGKSNAEMLETIRLWHTLPESKGGRGWSDIGYHRVFFPDGEWLSGRLETVVGAHAKGHNTGSLGWTMVPIRTISAMGEPEHFYTPEQIEAVRREILHLAERTPLRTLRGHNEVSAKLCPGFIVDDAYWTDLAVA